MNRHWLGFWAVCAFASFQTASAPAAPGESAPPPLTAKDVAAIWNEFGQHDEDGTQKALHDVRRLASAPTIVLPFLKEHLKIASGPDPKLIEQTIADLESNEFKKREKASEVLEKFGPLAAPYLEKKLNEKKLSPEAQNRLEELVEKFEDANRHLTGDDLRSIRGIEVLVQIGTPEARAIVDALSKGADGARLTLDARQALMAWPNKHP